MRKFLVFSWDDDADVELHPQGLIEDFDELFDDYDKAKEYCESIPGRIHAILDTDSLNVSKMNFVHNDGWRYTNLHAHLER